MQENSAWNPVTDLPWLPAITGEFCLHETHSGQANEKVKRICLCFVTEHGGKLYYCIIPKVSKRKSYADVFWKINIECEWAVTHLLLLWVRLCAALASDKIPPLLFLLQAWRPHQLLLQSLRQTPASGGGNFLGPPLRRWAGTQDHWQQCQWDASTPAGVDDKRP